MTNDTYSGNRLMYVGIEVLGSAPSWNISMKLN